MKYFKKDNYKGIFTFYEELIPINNDNCHEYVEELTSIITPDNLDIIRALNFLDNRIKQLERNNALLDCLSLGNELFDKSQTKRNKEIKALPEGERKQQLIKEQEKSIKNRDKFNLILASLKYD